MAETETLSFYSSGFRTIPIVEQFCDFYCVFPSSTFLVCPIQSDCDMWVEAWVEDWADTMGLELAKLSALKASRITKAGRYGDGGGLWLQVSGQGAKSWLFRFSIRGKARQMGLGPFSTISLGEAREAARHADLICFF